MKKKRIFTGVNHHKTVKDKCVSSGTRDKLKLAHFIAM